MKIALCGNPNVGKTTLFNRLTRSDAPVGNWHGVTVDARTKRAGDDVYITDLPGAYSLTPRTAEEKITCDQILFGDYDAFVYVAEVNNLRRNLYMLMQLAEADKPVALVVNMMDEAKGKVDLETLSARLGIPVVGASSKRKNPKTEILNAARAAIGTRIKRPDYLDADEVRSCASMLGGTARKTGIEPAFAALKAIERDADISSKLGIECRDCGGACGVCNVDKDTPARLRYAEIDKLLRGIREKPRDNSRTEKIDNIVLGKLALPVFMCVMAFVFVVTFEAGKPLSDMLSRLTARLCAPVRAADMPEWTVSLIADGVIAGVGAVLAFLPQIVILFLLTAVLQDSGYMSRVAFASDGFFNRFGLSGRAAFSLILGLGCSATAVLTTRGIAGDGARRRAAFATPFIPCSARLAVFTALTAYFGFSGFVVAGMYLLGCAAALAVLRIMRGRKAVEGDGFIMEMPPYRIPQLKRVASVVWRNVLAFAVRVGSTVLCVSVIMWVLCNFSLSQGFTGGGESSLMYTFADMIAPLFKPLGFGNWRAVSALLSGVAAKETVISVITALGGADAVFGSGIAAASFMTFTCLYVPCVATLSALAKESGVKSACLSVCVHTAIAYLASLTFYQSAVLFTANLTAFVAVYSSLGAAIVAAIGFSIVRSTAAKRRRAA